MTMGGGARRTGEIALVERRGKVRVGFRTEIVLEAGSSKIHCRGSACDLSLGGVFVDTRETIDAGTPCRIDISLSGTSVPVVLHVDGRIVRTGGTGMGIAFESMDLDSYAHLKNIVRYNIESENRD